MTRPLRPAPGVRREAVFLVWLANLAFATLLGTNWLVHLPEVDSARLWLFATAALVSTVLTLTLVPGLGFLALAHWCGRIRLLGLAQALGWTLFQVLLFADTRVFNMFRYHFNGQVLNLFYTRGSEDSIRLGWQVWTAIALGFAVVGSAQLWLWRRALVRAERRRSVGEPGHPLLRPSIVWGVVLLPAVFIEKTIYADADLNRDREITALARLFPLYARVPMEDLASKVLGVEVTRTPQVALEGVALDYPLSRLELDPAGERPNVLVLVVDCLRRDTLTPQTMPNVSAWSKDARRFQDHVSGGNSTRYGLFSLLYSLHGSYWFPFVQERRSPVLIDALGEAGYEFGVFAAASMNYPEFRDTAWSKVPEAVHDDYAPPEAWRRDELAARDLVSFLGERAADKAPFFGFLLLDSPHQTYSFPPEQAPFQPCAKEIDYMAMTRNDGPEPAMLEAVHNRYKNAIFYSDRLLGGILAAVDRLGLGEDTLIVVTGDHGEEFWECGFYGHTSAFTQEQIAVPFLLRGPGIEPGVEERPTSHLDFAPTVLERMGADPARRADWALGENLLAPLETRARVVSGWNELGIWAGNDILRVPLSLLDFDVDVFDRHWKQRYDDAEVLEREHDTLVQLGAACNRFLK